MAAIGDRRRLLLVAAFVVLFDVGPAAAIPAVSGDAAAMRALSLAVKGSAALGWSDSADPCSSWTGVGCSGGRVDRIQIGGHGLSGSLPPEIANLTALTRLEVMNNSLSGPLPSLAGLSSLQILLLNQNGFKSIPPDFFSGLTSLLAVHLDNNPFDEWSIPESLGGAAGLVNFSATNASIVGGIPEFFGTSFPGLQSLSLSYNKLVGGIPPAFAGSSITHLWLNGQANRALSGGIDVIANMTNLQQLWLQTNSFSGPIPDLSRLDNLWDFNLRDNRLTGPVPTSLINLKSLKSVVLTNNLLQGPAPQFPDSVTTVDVKSTSESFCLNDSGVECDPRVNVLLSIAGAMGYPARFAENWKGNDPCNSWLGITCDPSGNITIVNFQKMGLNGTISPAYQSLPSLQKLLLSDNNLTGSIPLELTKLASLKMLDLSRNALWGKLPTFDPSVAVNVEGNPDIGKDGPPPGPSDSGGDDSNSPGGSDGGRKSSSAKVILGSLVGAAAVAVVIGVLGFCYCKRRKHSIGRQQRPNGIVIHPQHSGSDTELIKISLVGAGSNGGTDSGSSGTMDLLVGDSGSMVISIQVLRNATNNFREDNILGRGGFGTVYKGELQSGSLIAVKRMEGGPMGSAGLDEFRSEISVLTRVRHRHLVSLLGYCLEDNERILVYEHMPQGTLSDHLFDWKKAGLKPLEWTRRLIIALDVARGVEYLHSLANQSFIHRDLKPSNILLGKNMRAKVADFGLVRLAPDGKQSFQTRLAGTFGYLAPEYAATGRVTTKVDIYSFGVILMELISGRRALDEQQPEDAVHLATWFRRMLINKSSFRDAVDPAIELEEEATTLASITTVAELALHCTAREPHQRPDMGHAVNVLSSLAEEWTPSGSLQEDEGFADDPAALREAVKRWQLDDASQTFGGTNYSSGLASAGNSQSSLPTRPSGFAESFTSADGR